MATDISTINIKASPERVWDTITNPNLVKLWQYGSDVISNWKVGQDIRFKTLWEDKIFEQWGKLLEIKPHERLRYSLFAPRPGLEDNPENYFEMNYILTSENNETKLVILQIDNRPGAVPEEPQGDENPVLQLLKKTAETF
ncbi:MAG: SRPBCC domain-containing protein [Chitinophagaceae bacterium]|nr:SRPBCC domain-containing protein [Chitinophagaceae bacterium]